MTDKAIRPFPLRRGFTLAHWISIGELEVITGYWNHAANSWVPMPEEATVFDTAAGAIVYRRGNMDRMRQLVDLGL